MNMMSRTECLPRPYQRDFTRSLDPGRRVTSSYCELTNEHYHDLAARVHHLCNKANASVALFVVELPGLLEIAEVFGEATRSSLVQETLSRLADQFGRHSVCCLPEQRLAIVCEKVSGDQIASVANKIQEFIGCCRSVSGVMVVGSPAIGVALHSPKAPGATAGASTSFEILLRRAELALHQASPEHNRSVQLYTEALDRQLRDSTKLRQSLLRAIDQQEFTLAYQPIVNLRDSRTTALEALIRWNLPCGGASQGPATFIPAAENVGLIVAIGAQTMDNAMTQASRWAQDGFATPRIAVNVSGQQLRDSGFLATVNGCLSRAKLSPRALELELTESILIESSSETIGLLKHLQDLGVVISIDDFGTGYSSLRYLQELPISKLKIDRSFISRITDGAKEQALVRAMINLASSFELEVVAEGIETSEQLAVLRELGCSHGQGYLFSRPLAAGDAVRCFGRDWAADRPA
jgi:EAL domain-containing protein (putative c-di-GMP-specific phosphodiesterase class I)